MTHSAFNDVLRRAARGQAVEPAPRDQVGSIGVGRGGGARAAPPARASSMEVSARIRDAARLQRSFFLPNGVRLEDVGDLDNLFGGR